MNENMKVAKGELIASRLWPLQGGWSLNAVGTNQVKVAVREGQACVQLTVAKDEPMLGLWGDGVDGHLRKRAEWSGPVNTGEARQVIEFATLIPQDWIPGPACNIFQLHQTGPAKPTPWMLQVREDELRFIGQIGGWHTWWKGLWVPEQWDDWRLEYVPHPVHGSFSLRRNGIEVASSNDTPTRYESSDNYAKTGLYVYGGTPEVIEAIPKYRRVYHRLIM